MGPLDICKFKKFIEQEIAVDYMHRNDTGVWDSSLQYVSNIYHDLHYSIAGYSPNRKLNTYLVRYGDDDAYGINSKNRDVTNFFGLVESSPYIFRNMRIGSYIRIIININGCITTHPIIYNQCIIPRLTFKHLHIETNNCLVENYE